MYCTKKITSDLIWLGGSDRRLALFENVYPIPRGVSYNAYLIQDEKTALLDTVDQAIAERFFENLEHALQGKPLNYVIVNHMEPDHAATLGTVLSRYPEATVIGNAKTLPMIKQFFPMEVEGRFQAVKEGDTLSLGRHELTFVMAPLVHWPEVMMTYDTTEKALFSADAFGTFGAMDGNIFADEVNFEQEWLDDARRYYTNIVGKYGTPVQNVLKRRRDWIFSTSAPSTVPSGGRTSAGSLRSTSAGAPTRRRRGQPLFSAAPSTATRKTPARSWPPVWRKRACGTCGSSTCPTPTYPSRSAPRSSAAIWCLPAPPTTAASTPPWRRCCWN